MEFSVSDHVILTLADDAFSKGLFGVYLESAQMQLRDVELRQMHDPAQSPDHLVTG